MRKTAEMLALLAIMVSITGCQLLIDNRSRESGAVVVVPSEEWEAMRQAGHVGSQAATISKADEIAIDQPSLEIKPTPGSEAITFSNYTSSNLGGCVATSVIELHHRGTVNDAITLLKNEAFRLNANALIVIKMNNILEEFTSTINIEARLLTCPLRIAKGN